MELKQTHLILQEELEQLRQRIIDNMRAAGEVATGKTIASMQVYVDGGYGVLEARPYFAALETGSRPWRNAQNMVRVPRKFADIIGEWIEAKSLNLNKWAVAYKIIHEGTALYRQGGRNDIFSNEIPKTIESLGERLMVIYSVQINEQLNTILQ